MWMVQNEEGEILFEGTLRECLDFAEEHLCYTGVRVWVYPR